MANKTHPVLYFLWLFAVCSSLAGVQFVYSIQFAVGTPLFIGQLKVPSSLSAIILATAGPISGFIIQPVIGVLSDGCQSRFGRRRPFILVGVIFCVVGMALIGNADFIGHALGDNPQGQTMAEHKGGLAFAIVGLWIMNLFVNVIQGPARAIVSDIVEEEKQQLGNAMVSNVMGLAAIIANVIGAQLFGTPEPYRYLFIGGIGCLLLSAIPTLIFAKETPLSDLNFGDIQGEPAPKIGIIGVFKKIGVAFITMPSEIRRIALLFFFSWAGYSPFMIFITNYFAENIYHGDPTTNPDAYNYGVKIGMYGLAISAAVQWAYSLMLPTVVKVLRVKGAYFLSQLIATACFILFIWFAKTPVALVLMGLIAINFTTFNSVPFALLGSSSSKADAGLYMGVLNSASVVAQTVTNFIASPIIKWQNQNVAWGIALGGIFSFIACFLVFLLKVPAPEQASKAERARLLDEEN